MTGRQKDFLSKHAGWIITIAVQVLFLAWHYGVVGQKVDAHESRIAQVEQTQALMPEKYVSKDWLIGLKADICKSLERIEQKVDQHLGQRGQ